MAFNALSFDRPPTMDSLQGSGFQIELNTNPSLSAKISIDGHVYTSPTTVSLKPGQHTFSAISQVAGGPMDQYVTYAFNCWRINGKCVSYMPTALLAITGSLTVTAQYMLGEGNWGSPAQPDSLPNPTGPMTPPLVLNNSRQNILNSDPRTKEV
jgi:hypothetical protein